MDENKSIFVDFNENKKKFFKKTLTLTEVIETCKEWSEGKKTTEEINEWCKNIKIRKFLSHQEKNTILYNLVEECDYEDFFIGVKLMELEMKKFWYMKLYYTNITISRDEEIMLTTLNYDLCEFCLGEWLDSYCGRDYKRMEKLLNNSLILGSIESLNKSLSMLDYDKIAESYKDFGEIIKDMNNNSEVISELNNIALLNDPLLREMRYKATLDSKAQKD